MGLDETYKYHNLKTQNDEFCWSFGCSVKVFSNFSKNHFLNISLIFGQ